LVRIRRHKTRLSNRLIREFDEFMNAHRHRTIIEARNIAEEWRQNYNANHPHSSLGNRTPEEFFTLSDISQRPQESLAS
jgi:transposase InsO family protein